MFDGICSLPLESELFAQVIHPEEQLITVGLSSGHVATLRLPPLENALEKPSKRKEHLGNNGTDTIDTLWKTRRHEDSCRCLAYSSDGRQIYSAGADGLVKAAETETGRVTGKVVIPKDHVNNNVDAPTVIHALSPQTLLVTTDAGALHQYDLRDPAPSAPVNENKTAFISAKPSSTHHPHTDYISSLSPITVTAASTSGFSKQWLTTGGTTLALTDLRRGVLVQSEDQEEILLSSLYVTGLPTKKTSRSTGEKAYVGDGAGVLSIWEKGQWENQDQRITVSKEKETLDCLASIPDGIGGPGKKIAVGLGNGKVRFVRLGANQIIGEVQHDEVEGVTSIGFDTEGRMITGGGSIIKVWRETLVGEDDLDDSDDGSVATKRTVDVKDDYSSDDEKVVDSSDDDDDHAGRKKRKKRKKGQSMSQKSGLNFAGLD